MQRTIGWPTPVLRLRCMSLLALRAPSADGYHGARPEGHLELVAEGCNRHIVLVRQLLGDAVKVLEVDQGVASSQDPVPFLAIGHLWFDSVEDFQAGLAAQGPAIMADIANYTNVEPCPFKVPLGINEQY